MTTRPSQKNTAEELDQGVFRHVVGHFATGVTVITTRDEESKSYGTTASAVSSLSLEPPMLLVCLNRTSSTGRVIAAANRFAVNILGEDEGDLATHFASKATNKFEGIAVSHGTFGQPLLSTSLAQLECEVVEQAFAGTHVIFISRVLTASARPGAPLAYFRGRFGRFLEINDDAAYRALRSLMLKRTLPIDESFEIDELAERLAAERPSVIYALARLTQEGLVVRSGPSTYRVQDIDESLITKAIRARCALTLGVIETTIDDLPDEKVALVQRAVKAAETLPGENLMEYGRALKDFHEVVIGLSDNSLILDTYRRLSVPTILAHAVGKDTDWETHHPVLTSQRRRLAEALERRDRAKAVDATIQYHEAVLMASLHEIRAAGPRI